LELLGFVPSPRLYQPGAIDFPLIQIDPHRPHVGLGPIKEKSKDKVTEANVKASLFWSKIINLPINATDVVKTEVDLPNDQLTNLPIWSAELTTDQTFENVSGWRIKSITFTVML
jgi:hypothetical protein